MILFLLLLSHLNRTISDVETEIQKRGSRGAQTNRQAATKPKSQAEEARFFAVCLVERCRPRTGVGVATGGRSAQGGRVGQGSRSSTENQDGCGGDAKCHRERNSSSSSRKEFESRSREFGERGQDSQSGSRARQVSAPSRHNSRAREIECDEAQKAKFSGSRLSSF